MKKFAFFLPQFHTIPENDLWWGIGFTEWTNVRKARPLFNGHNQPMRPLNENYYNLLDKEVVEWQTQLMQKYHIDGLIYYHYYFEGKKLLEKPAENLLRWGDIKQHFFFCWANHSWKKTWNGTSELLVEQTYGTEENWEEHFQYLLPFFKDDRYEKKENKPLFMFFKSDFAEKKKMIEYFNKRCVDEGFNGLYVIESFHGDISAKRFLNNISEQTEAVFCREPAISHLTYLKQRNTFIKGFNKFQGLMRRMGFLKKPRIYSGEKLMSLKCKNELLDDRVIRGLWFEWDNTVRHGYRGYVITPYSKEIFKEYMDKVKNDEYLFINAWNEWCEGMMLEPTEENGYKYLEWIKEWSEKDEIM